jgi:hypothetical protein
MIASSPAAACTANYLGLPVKYLIIEFELINKRELEAAKFLIVVQVKQTSQKTSRPRISFLNQGATLRCEGARFTCKHLRV